MKLFNYKLWTDDIIQVDKTIRDGEVTVFVRNMTKDPSAVISYIKYKDLGWEVESPLLRWENLILCSNYYSVCPEPNYNNTAVQKGYKTGATVFPSDSEEKKKLISQCKNRCFADRYNCNKLNLFIHVGGCLRNHFDLDMVKSAYDDRDIIETGSELIDWNKISAYFDMPLKDFSDSETYGIDLQSGGFGDDAIIVGLVLGYPVESTVAFLTSRINSINTCMPPKEPEPWQDVSLYL